MVHGALGGRYQPRSHHPGMSLSLGDADQLAGPAPLAPGGLRHCARAATSGRGAHHRAHGPCPRAQLDLSLFVQLERSAQPGAAEWLTCVGVDDQWRRRRAHPAGRVPWGGSDQRRAVSRYVLAFADAQHPASVHAYGRLVRCQGADEWGWRRARGPLQGAGDMGRPVVLRPAAVEQALGIRRRTQIVVVRV